MPLTKAGLEDVVAANSAVCEVIGSEGRLTYRGIDIHDLAQHSSFEETTYLLWFGHLPERGALEGFSAELAANRQALPEVLDGGGQLFDPAKPEDLVVLLRKVTDDREFRHELTQRAVTRRKDFSWARTAAATADVYEEVLRGA